MLIIDPWKTKFGGHLKVFTDAGYQGVEKRPETQGLEVNWQVAMRPGKRKALDKSSEVGRLVDQLERTKASIRAKVEHPFRVIKRQFGYMKVRYKGLMKNTHLFFWAGVIGRGENGSHSSFGVSAGNVCPKQGR